MMKLYHGSNTKIEVPDLVHSKPFKDFGCDQLRRYEGGVISLSRLVEELKYAKGITFQYYFGSDQALQLLKRL